MYWLHVNALVRDVEEAVYAHEGQDVFDLDFLSARYHAFFAQLLQPRLVELIVYCVLREDVMFEDQLIEIILIGLTTLLVQHVYVTQCIEKLCNIVELDVYVEVKLLFAVCFLEILCKVF